MSGATDHDYADVINPYVRAEQEAEMRGFRKGVLVTIHWLSWIVVIGMALYSFHAHANVTWVEQTWAPIKASQCGGSISICQNNATGGTWLCYCVR